MLLHPFSVDPTKSPPPLLHCLYTYAYVTHIFFISQNFSTVYVLLFQKMIYTDLPHEGSLENYFKME